MKPGEIQDDQVDVRAVLQRHQASILDQLVRLVVQDRSASQAALLKAKADALVRDFRNTANVIAGLAPVARELRYSGFKVAIDAIQAYFLELDEPATEADIISALTAGGFCGGKPGTASNIARSLTILTSGSKTAEARLKKVGDLYGLGSWDKSRFNRR